MYANTYLLGYYKQGVSNLYVVDDYGNLTSIHWSDADIVKFNLRGVIS